MMVYNPAIDKKEIKRMISKFTATLKNDKCFRFVCFTGKPELQFRDRLACDLRKNFYISKETTPNGKKGKKKRRADLVLYRQSGNKFCEKLFIELKASCLFDVIKKSNEGWQAASGFKKESSKLEGQLEDWGKKGIGIFLITYLKPDSNYDDCKL